MKLFQTTAAAALISMAATVGFADSHKAASEDMASHNMAGSEMPQYIRSRDITGGAVYSTAPDSSMWNDIGMFDMNADGVTQIGEIEDIVLDSSGKMIGVIAEVGGFLDIGDKHVMLPVENVRLKAVDDESIVIVTTKSEEELEKLESVDEGFWN